MRPGLNAKSVSRLTAISLLALVLVAVPAAAQFVALTPPSVGPYPSVTSLGGRHTPNILPSVTSIPNYGYHYGYGPYFNTVTRTADTTAGVIAADRAM